jgi:hypothetical protein
MDRVLQWSCVLQVPGSKKRRQLGLAASFMETTSQETSTTLFLPDSLVAVVP